MEIPRLSVSELQKAEREYKRVLSTDGSAVRTLDAVVLFLLVSELVSGVRIVPLVSRSSFRQPWGYKDQGSASSSVKRQASSVKRQASVGNVNLRFGLASVPLQVYCNILR
jgi:hypothetical protein